MIADCRLDILRAVAGPDTALGEAQSTWGVFASGLASVSGEPMGEIDQGGGAIAGVRLVAVMRRTAKLAGVTAADRARVAGLDYAIQGAPLVTRERVTLHLTRPSFGHV